MFTLTNGVFFTGKDVINDKHMVVDGGRILGFVSESTIPDESEVINLQGKNVAPGFIDLQINGGCGKFFDKKITLSHISVISENLAKYGVTRWMPTFLSLPKSDMMKLQSKLEILQGKHGVLGVHLEGPWIDEDKAGVHTANNLRNWEVEDFDFIKQATNSGLVCVTLSCLRIQPSDIVTLSNMEGVRVLLGHTLATYEDAVDFFSRGGSGVTHIFNAMSQPCSREPGIITAAMENGNVRVSVIADLFHVDVSILRLLKRAFESDTVYLVSDTMPVFCSDASEFSIDGNICKLSDGRIIDEKGRLAGSAITIADAIRNCIQSVGIPMDEALRMGSLYPAKAIGIDDNYGYLECGYKADFTVFNNQLQIFSTYRDGELLFEQ